MPFQHSLFVSFSLFFFSIGSLFSQTTCNEDNLITNGSMDGTVGMNITANGWQAGWSPDINDHLNPLYMTYGYNWAGVPLESFDGGTWQNLFGHETISQVVYCTIGEWYELTFLYAAQGVVSSEFVYYAEPIGVSVFFDEDIVFETPDDETQYTWETATYTFQASVETFTLKMDPTQEQYVGIDGVCLMKIDEPVSVEDYTSSLPVEMYPNPANSLVTITGIEHSDARIIVIDTNGRRVEDLLINGDQQVPLDVSSWHAGIYFVQVYAENQRWIDRLVVQP